MINNFIHDVSLPEIDARATNQEKNSKIIGMTLKALMSGSAKTEDDDAKKVEAYLSNLAALNLEDEQTILNAKEAFAAFSFAFPELEQYISELNYEDFDLEELTEKIHGEQQKERDNEAANLEDQRRDLYFAILGQKSDTEHFILEMGESNTRNEKIIETLQAVRDTGKFDSISPIYTQYLKDCKQFTDTYNIDKFGVATPKKSRDALKDYETILASFGDGIYEKWINDVGDGLIGKEQFERSEATLGILNDHFIAFKNNMGLMNWRNRRNPHPEPLTLCAKAQIQQKEK